MADQGSYICLYLPPDRTWHKVNDPKVDYSGDLGEGMSGMSQGSSPAWLCCSSAHLVQCKPDEPSWTWTQIWIQARLPDYSLNWTARSSAIQGRQRYQWCNSPTWRWPSQSRGPFDLKSAMEFWPSGTNARQFAEKPLHKAKADQACQLFPVRDLSRLSLILMQISQINSSVWFNPLSG